MPDEHVNVTVFGPGYGESIVTNIPGLGWGVIDSCLVAKGKQRTNPALEYLLDQHVTELAFIILTHPHEDHFLGIDLIIEHYLGHIKKIFYYTGVGIREYRVYLSKKSVLQGGGELHKLATVYKSFEKAKNRGAEIFPIAEQTLIANKVKTHRHQIDIVALSPSADSIRKYTEILFKAIPVNEGETFNFLSDDHHNLLSTVIWCEIGKIRLILGSDLENGDDDQMGWRRIVSSTVCPNLSSQLVKVSHHGSAGAFHKPAWDKFNHDSNPISIITPYNRSRRLPQDSMIRQIATYSKQVAITSQPKYLKANKVYDRSVVDNMIGVKDWSVIVEPETSGYVSVDLSPEDGTVTNVKIGSPAFLYNEIKSAKA